MVNPLWDFHGSMVLQEAFQTNRQGLGIPARLVPGFHKLEIQDRLDLASFDFSTVLAPLCGHPCKRCINSDSNQSQSWQQNQFVGLHLLNLLLQYVVDEPP
jgi:hypothetical protein